uniref:WAP domain-containing protein n=1 Tax=Leptobrachium leishanense TaxID=445787 RepID=A0A8C5MAQ0_9ANUR
MFLGDFWPLPPWFGINPRQQVRHTDSSQTQAAGTDMSPVVSSLLLGLVLCWSGTQATEPAVVALINVCPPFDATICPMAKPENNKCQTDSQCLGGEICCCSNCILKCVPPEQVKRGRCPPNLERCKPQVPRPLCQSDRDCTGKQKCCEMCGKVCLDPVEEQRLLCPAIGVTDEKSLTCASFLCSRHLDCQTDERCCVSGNGKKCVKIPKDLFSVCPRFDPSTCPLAKPDPEECKTDSQCLGDKICCCSNCGLKCVTPEQVRLGRCPPVEPICKLPLPDSMCKSDRDCSGKQKCCDSCGKQCRFTVEEPLGVCPASGVIEGKSLTCPSVFCSRDTDCLTDEKCCVFGDSKRCVKSSPDLINVCPHFDRSICPLVKPGPDDCKTDSQCLGGKICCCSNCGLKCVYPEQVKPGRCPAIVVRCKMPLPDPKCWSDRDCTGKQKCCEMCGISCQDPVEEPRVLCPAIGVNEGKSLTCVSFECSRDSDCQTDEKCCVSGNGKKCLKSFPVAELINVCPPFDPSTCLLAKPGPEECKNDSQCLGGKKCCCSNCGLKCVPPEQVRPGRCPSFVLNCKTPLPDPMCQSDHDCPGRKKCCDNCGKNCWDPVEEPRVLCPAIGVNEGKSLTCVSFECSRDSDCKSDEKCCVSGNGKKCLKPPKDVELINVCPPFDPSICLLAKPGPEGCKTDSQCLGGKKCCCSNCGLNCVSPEQVKPGRCPLNWTKCKLPLPGPMCQSDRNCSGTQKCCDICGKKCSDPVEEPRGVCPASETGRSLTCASIHCSADSDCLADEKCCASGDGKKCLKPSTVKPGRCPPEVVRCKPPEPEPKCKSDLECLGKQKCCDLCGVSCRDPVEDF